MNIEIMTYEGPVWIEIDVGYIVRIHPDTRGTFIPILRDEECSVLQLSNRGTKKRPEWWALVKQNQGTWNPQTKTRNAPAERWIDVANLQVIQ